MIDKVMRLRYTPEVHAIALTIGVGLCSADAHRGWQSNPVFILWYFKDNNWLEIKKR